MSIFCFIFTFYSSNILNTFHFTFGADQNKLALKVLDSAGFDLLSAVDPLAPFLLRRFTFFTFSEYFCFIFTFYIFLFHIRRCWTCFAFIYFRLSTLLLPFYSDIFTFHFYLFHIEWFCCFIFTLYTFHILWCWTRPGWFTLAVDPSPLFYSDVEASVIVSDILLQSEMDFYFQLFSCSHFYNFTFNLSLPF